MNIFEVKNININYVKNYYALLNVNLQFQIGKHYMIVGESESGKSTLVRLIAGLEKKYSGEILLDGQVIDLNNEFFKNEIGFINDKGVFLERKSVLDNLSYAFYIRNDKMTTCNFNDVLEKFDLLEIKEKRLKDLCRLERIKVALARLSLRKFTFLILDEIFECLTKEEISYLFKKIKLLNFKSMLITSKANDKYANFDFQIINMKAGFIVKDN